MADLLFKCLECSKHLAVDEAAKGRSVKCVDCGKPVRVPADVSAVNCPACAWELALPPSLAGETFHCPNCDGALVVPKSSVTLSAPSRHEPQASQRPSTTGRQCPGCGRPIAPTVAVCLFCGVDQQTGKPRLTLKKAAAGAKEAPPAPRSSFQPTRASTDARIHEAQRALAKVRARSGSKTPRPGLSEETNEPGATPPTRAMVLTGILLMPGSVVGAVLLGLGTGKPYIAVLGFCILLVSGIVLRGMGRDGSDWTNGLKTVGGVTIGFLGAAALIWAKASWHDRADGPSHEQMKIEQQKQVAEAGSGQPADTKQVSSVLPGSAAGMDDDQLYGYIKVKQEKADTPVEKVALLEAYLQKYPKGRHTGEATALLEDAKNAEAAWHESQKVGEALIRCTATLGSGQTIPVKGWMQLVRMETLRELDEASQAIANDSQLKLRFEMMDNASRRGDRADFNSQVQAIFERDGEVNSEALKGTVVATGTIGSDGNILFSAVPPGQYYYYGAGYAGLNAMGYVGACPPVEGGKRVSVSDPSHFSALGVKNLEWHWRPLR